MIVKASSIGPTCGSGVRTELHAATRMTGVVKCPILGILDIT